MALWAVVLVASPAVAQAQAAKHDANPRGAERPVVVVSPGDSLWSISAEVLGGDATPQRIAEGVELIYARNQNRIGPDPNLIIVGQRLSLPQAAMDGGAVSNATNAKASTAPPSAAREGARRTAAADTLPKRSQEVNAGQKTEQIAPAAATGNETPRLPRVAEEAAPAVPSGRQATSEASAQSAVLETLTEVRTAAAENPRQTLGWVILVLTAVAGTIMAWKLPMRRTTSRDAQRWAPYGYYGREHHTTYSVNLAMPTVERDEGGQREPHRNPAPPTPAAFEESSTNGSEANGSGSKRSKVVRHPLAGGAPRRGLAKQRRLGRAAARSSGRSVVRNGLVPGVTRAEVHHALRVPPNGGIQAVRRRVGRRR